MRKSRPSFSELAPVIPPGTIPTPPPSNVSPSRPPPPIPYVPSVIIAEDEPPAPTPRSLEPTVRARRSTTVRKKRRGLNKSLVILVLMMSLVVFGVGIAAFVATIATRPATPPPAPTINAADMPPPSVVR
jgi:hypothetical protein